MRKDLGLYAALILSSSLLAGSAGAIEPLGGSDFNVKAKVDLKTLDRANFVAVLTPVAKGEGASELVFYDFADTLCDLLAKESQGFTDQTGIKVKHVCVDGDTATQQIIAAEQSGSKPPVDVFFGPNNSMRAMTKAGAIANLPLVTLVPQAQDLDQEAALRSRGFQHGGTVLPFHRNQTVIAYDAAKIAEPPSGLVEIFDYAKAHDLKVAVTNPTKGGSGSGFIESALLALAPEPMLLSTGEVGDGDGIFVLASTDKVEAALLYVNFLMGDQVQIDKLEQTGSRTARLDLQTAGKIPDRLATYLVPDQLYHERTRPRINGQISDAAADIFVAQVIAQ